MDLKGERIPQSRPSKRGHSLSRSVSDLLVLAREAILDLIVPASGVLNASHADISVAQTTPAVNITALLAKTIRQLKMVAMDETGHYVDYDRLCTSGAYLAFRTALGPQLRALDLTTLTTQEEQLAFWINLYNVLILDAVITFNVQKSVTEDWLGVITFFRRAAYNVGGYRFSANDIEHGILRGNRGFPYTPGPHFASSDPRRQFVVTPFDPRIHFALNCASRSCPPISVYEVGSIHEQLDLAARSFINAEVEVVSAQSELRLSALFRWYKGDFGGRKGILKVILHHLPDNEAARWLGSYVDDVQLSFKPYDWSLNRLTSNASVTAN